MKLLLDENLSPNLVRILVYEFPDSGHLDILGMRGATDRTVWEYAGNQNYTIVSKDNDFRQRAFLDGPTPKIIWFAVGNTGTQAIAALLRRRAPRIESFIAHPEDGLLVPGLE